MRSVHRTYDLWNDSPIFCQLSYKVRLEQFSFELSHTRSGSYTTNILALTTLSQCSEWTVGPPSSATCSPMFMQFTGCDQAIRHSCWPENATDLLK